MDKKAIAYVWNWPEIWMIVMFVVGFVVAISTKSAAFNYIVVVIAGAMAGKFLFERRKATPFPYYLIIIGLGVGYILGSFRFNIRLVSFLFVISIIASYYAHKKKLVKWSKS